MPVDTERLAQNYRAATVDVGNRKLLITNFCGTGQEQDLTEPPNCGGFGRIRHFRRATSQGWPPNPLPIDPACARLGLGHQEEIRAQVFQNAACNWRCWYCFVPFNLLSANPEYSAWLTPEELARLFISEPDYARVLDLSGGQPELVPEWVYWMMQEIDRIGLRGKVYLWSDDNLSCDYFWRYLSEEQQEFVATYPFYSRVVCFKGFDEESFQFNTSAEKSWFSRQFELMSRLAGSGMDLYAYVTLTTGTLHNVTDAVKRFVDKLQAIDEKLPLRTVPLEIREFAPVLNRLNDARREALHHQWRAVEAWQQELDDRFPAELKCLPITDVHIGNSTLV
jgi:uncharacterized Fe-S cluster-containing radical SAM superfamily protein